MKGVEMKKFYSVISLLFLVLFLLLSCNKSSSDWVEYKNENGYVISYKKVSIDKDDIVKAWGKTVNPDKTVDNVLWEVDCRGHRDKILSTVKNDKDGKILFSQDFSEDNWSYIVPDSNTSPNIIQKKFCP